MKIITDCAANLTNEDIEQHQVTVAPLFIQFPEGEVNSADLSTDEFFDKLEAMIPDVPTTAQPSPAIFAELFRQAAMPEESVLCINISSGLSGTYDSAVQGAKQITDRDVNVVDSHTLAGGQRFQVLAAALAAKAGWAMDAIQDRLAKIRAATEVIYTLDTLEYLARGGRIGRVQALAGSLLHLKPVIHVDKADGKYSTVGKGRTLPKAMNQIVEYLLQTYGAETPLWMSIQHGRLPERAAELAQSMKDKLNIVREEVLRVSPVLGVHTGPGIVGMAIMPFDLIKDLV
jgi:DegV family protein with EDD domain